MTKPENSTNGDLKVLLPAFASFHLALLFYDFRHNTAFLGGDRAGTRISNIEDLVQVMANDGSLTEFLSTHGLMGDYIFHGAAYLLGGTLGFLVLQIVFAIVALGYIYKLTLLLTRSRSAARIATVAYFFLPHTLAYPHLLTTESISNPLLIVSFYYFTYYVLVDRTQFRYLSISALAIAFSMLVRPVPFLFPLLAFALLVTAAPKYFFKYTGSYLILAFVPLVLWMTFMHSSIGEFTLGTSGGTLQYNLYLKVGRMLSAEEREINPIYQSGTPDKTLSPAEYARFLKAHPDRFLNLLKFDLANLLANSGVNKFFGYYLKLYDLGEDRGRRWGKIVDEQGIIKGVLDVMGQSPGFILATIVFTLLWLTLCAIAMVGWYRYIKSGENLLVLKVFYTLYPIYIIFVTLAIVSEPRSGHRSSFDFIVCMFAAMPIAQRWGRIDQPDLTHTSS